MRQDELFEIQISAIKRRCCNSGGPDGRSSTSWEKFGRRSSKISDRRDTSPDVRARTLPAPAPQKDCEDARRFHSFSKHRRAAMAYAIHNERCVDNYSKCHSEFPIRKDSLLGFPQVIRPVSAVLCFDREAATRDTRANGEARGGPAGVQQAKNLPAGRNSPGYSHFVPLARSP